MLGITGGCEPEFAIKYTRKTDNLKDSYDIYCREAQYYMDKFNTRELPEYFVCSSDVEWKDRVDLQGIMQKHVDTAISSTVNLPNNISINEVEQLYLYAWEKGLKGITIYRDGCKRSGILVTENTKTDTSDKEPQKLSRGDIIQVNDDVIGKKRKLTTGCGSLHCSAFFDPITGQLLETYLSKGSQGGCANSLTGLSRMISLALRAGCDIHTVIDQLNSCGTCPSYAIRRVTKGDTSKGACCPTAIGNALLEMYEEMQEEIFCEDIDDQTQENFDSTYDDVKKQDNKKIPSHKASLRPTNVRKVKCPECGEALIPEGGCFSCKVCGYSKCD